jgi:hypothetical protein
MAGTSKSESKSSTRVPGTTSVDAIELLTQDHEEVTAMF